MAIDRNRMGYHEQQMRHPAVRSINSSSELENAMERAVVIGSSDSILAEDLPETVLESVKGGGSAPAKYHDAIRNLKKQLILGALDQGEGNVTEAAKLLGVHANYLHRLMRNFELRPTMKKQTGA